MGGGMSEKVDQVAKAIADYWLSDGFDPSEPSDGAARAAIAAMREPTEAMQDAGIRAPEAIRPSCDHEVVVNPGRIWRQMIDEALK
jgi:hypothetical protein